MEKLLLDIDIVSAKLAYIIASLASYSSLDLSKRLNLIVDELYLIKKSLIESKQYIDIRNVVAFREDVKALKDRVKPENEIIFSGHKIACLLFEVSIYFKQLNQAIKQEDYQEYMLLASEYTYLAGRLVNKELLSQEKIIINEGE